MLRTTGGDSKRDSGVEESTESPNALLFIRRLVAERPTGDDRKLEGSRRSFVGSCVLRVSEGPEAVFNENVRRIP